MVYLYIFNNGLCSAIVLEDSEDINACLEVAYGFYGHMWPKYSFLAHP